MPYPTNALLEATILVVEDEYFLADYMVAVIQSVRGLVEGPFPSVAEGRNWLHGGECRATAATLNVNLLDGPSYPLADDLVLAGMPFVFVSAYGRKDLPERFEGVPMLVKPFAAYQVVEALTGLLGTGERAS